MNAATLHTPVPAPDPEASGLCRTCHHAGSCAYLFQATAPVHQCELFDDGPPVASDTRKVRLVEVEPVADLLTSSPGAGLCLNCDNRQNCLLPRAPGGVWHCEEYR